jgi:hypothetical protein
MPKNVETRPDGSFEGSGKAWIRPTYQMSTADGRRFMTAEILKRKLRNFPVASLSQRITATS